MMASDFRQRYVSLWWLAAFAVTVFTAAAVCHGLTVAGVNLLINMCLIVLLGAVLLIYFRLKTGRWLNLLRRHLGSGDLFFFLYAAPLFSLRGFLVFMIASMVLSLVWWLFNRTKTIPLVGLSGGVLALYLGAWWLQN